MNGNDSNPGDNNALVGSYIGAQNAAALLEKNPKMTRAEILEKLEKTRKKYPVEKARGRGDKYDQL